MKLIILSGPSCGTITSKKTRNTSTISSRSSARGTRNYAWWSYRQTWLKGNRHAHRLEHKPSKRDLEMSVRSLLHAESEYRMYSFPGEFTDKEICRIDNTDLSPKQVARMIQERYKL